MVVVVVLLVVVLVVVIIIILVVFGCWYYYVRDCTLIPLSKVCCDANGPCLTIRQSFERHRVRGVLRGHTGPITPSSWSC